MRYNQTKQGLYFQGEFKAENWQEAVKCLYNMNEIPQYFCIDEDYEATGYSIVDSRGIEHIYDLAPSEFYNFLNKLN